MILLIAQYSQSSIFHLNIKPLYLGQFKFWDNPQSLPCFGGEVKAGGSGGEIAGPY